MIKIIQVFYEWGSKYDAERSINKALAENGIKDEQVIAISNNEASGCDLFYRTEEKVQMEPGEVKWLDS